MAAESPSPVVRRISAGRFAEGPGYHTYRSRGTTDWLIIHTVGGRGRFGNGTVEIPALPGDTTLLRPGVVHDYGVEPTLLRWSIVFAHFHPRADWAPLLDWPEPIAGVMQVHSVGEVERRVTASLDDAARLSRGALPNREQFGLNALEAALLWCATQNSRQRMLDERVLRALDHIDAHLAQPLSVGAIARTVSLSESRFAHLFADQVGMSPSRYVESQRMSSAMQLLELTTRPVNEIAAQVGFADPLYFSTRFRRHTGHSPLRYREHAESASHRRS